MGALVLPKGYLSHSAITLWDRNQEKYRELYYYGMAPISSPEMRYGSHIHRMIEDNDPSVAHIPRFDTSELKLNVIIDGVPILAYVDSFHSRLHSFIEYKTGKTSKTGKAPWNRVKVRKHDQLPFYALLIDEKYGSTALTRCELIWIETVKLNKQTKVAGFSSKNKYGLELTGKVETWERVIQKHEKELQRKRIVEVANQISTDYKKYLSNII